jgi:hypothetical protein
MIALNLESYLGLVDEVEMPEDARSYLYSERSMVKLFLYALIKGMIGFKTIHQHLQEKPSVLHLVGFTKLPHRTTLSRRFKAMPTSLRQMLGKLHEKFVEAAVIQLLVMSTDSSLMHAHGNIWHAKDMKAGKLPTCGNIDREAHWDISGAGGWVFGYRLHCLVNAEIGIPLPRDIGVHPANVKDGKVFVEESSTSLHETTEVVLGDGGYDEQACYEVCDAKGISLITPIQVKKNTPLDRRERAALYNDPEVREVFALRKATVEPFQGHLKDLFGLEYLPLKGLANVRALVTCAALAYLLLVYLNYRLGRNLLCLKATLLAIR